MEQLGHAELGSTTCCPISGQPFQQTGHEGTAARMPCINHQLIWDGCSCMHLVLSRVHWPTHLHLSMPVLRRSQRLPQAAGMKVHQASDLDHCSKPCQPQPCSLSHLCVACSLRRFISCHTHKPCVPSTRRCRAWRRHRPLHWRH